MKREPDTRAAYERWHEVHSSCDAGTQGPWYSMAKELLTSRPSLFSDSRVLEIGCGSGDFCAWIATQGANDVVGADFSSVAIRIAKERHAAPNLKFRVGDIQNIAHEASSFDLVVSCETIEHVPQPARAVRELARVLRPGGTLLLSVPNYLSITGAYRVYLNALGRKWDEGGQPLVNWTAYPRTGLWVRRAGLVIRSTRGDGYYVPVRGRPGGLALSPPTGLQRWAKYAALHVLWEAGKPIAHA